MGRFGGACSCFCLAIITTFYGCAGGTQSVSRTVAQITISNLSPNQQSVQTPTGTGITLTVTGTNFTSQSVVMWNGNARPTTFVSNTKLTAAISAADLSVQGNAAVTVSDASLGTSNSLSFGIGQPPSSFVLSVTSSVGGIVSSSDGGINCGSMCLHSYSPGTSVTLTAAAGSGYQFTGWSGACTGMASCTVTISQASSVTANFVANSSVVSRVGTATVISTDTLGGSTTSCIDKDGDGYGTGPGCAGPDADDRDATVHSSSDVLAKYGSITAFLNHLGYSPLGYIVVSNTGSDACTATTDFASAAAAPCLTFSKALSLLQPGYILIARAGTYTFTLSPSIPVSGTQTNPVILMAYPGEVATLDFSAVTGGLSFVNQSYITIDGLHFANASGSGSLSGGTYYGGAPDPTPGPSKAQGITIRNVDITNSHWGIIIMDGLQNVLIEDSAIHDEYMPGGEHNIYLGSRSVPSSNVTVRRNLLFHAGYTGLQFNGRVTNLDISNNIIHSNDLGCISLEMGVSSSSIHNNVCFNNGRAGIVFYDYDSGICANQGTSGQYGICPWDESGNIIQNNSIWIGNTDRNGVAIDQQPCFTMADDSSTGPHNFANTFRNNICVNQSGWMFDIFHPLSPLSNTLILDNVYYAAARSGTDIMRFDLGGTPTTYTFAQLAAQFPGNVYNNQLANPLFVATDVSWWNTPNKFNLKLLPGSPATGVGYSPNTVTTNAGWASLGSATALTSYASGGQCPNSAAYSGVEGATHCPNGVYAYSGGTYDETNHRLLLWGGGHADWGGNDVYEISMFGTPTLTRLVNFSLPGYADSTSYHEAMPDGTPNVRHTYGALVAVPPVSETGNKALLLSFGGVPAAGNGTFSDGVWELDLSSLPSWNLNPFASWTQRFSTGTYNTTFQGWGAVAVYDPNSHTVLAGEASGANQGRLYKYELGTHQLQQLIAMSFVSDGESWPTLGETAAVDTARRLLFNVKFNNHKFIYVDISSLTPNGSETLSAANVTTSSIDATCAGAVTSYLGLTVSDSVAYDPVFGVFVLYPGHGNTVYLLNPGDPFHPGSPTDTAVLAGSYGTIAPRQCLAVSYGSVQGSDYPPDAFVEGQAYSAYNRFSYVPDLDEFVYSPAPGQPAWILKLKR